jgi:hypothetical protein
MYLNDKGATMICGLYVGDSNETFNGLAVPPISTSISVHVVDLVAEISLTYTYNNGDEAINPT